MPAVPDGWLHALRETVAPLGVPIAWLQLAEQRSRLAAAIAGITFAVVLMLMQLGFHDALYKSATRVHSSLRGDLVMISSQYEFAGQTGSFSQRRLVQALADPRVSGVAPLLVATVQWKNPQTTRERPIFVLGVDPSNSALDLPAVDRALPLFRRPDSVAFDTASRIEFGDLGALLRERGRVYTEAAGHRVSVDALFALGGSFAADGNIATSDRNLRRIAGQPPPGVIHVGVIRLKDPASALEVRDALRKRIPGDVSLLTKEEFVALEKKYWANRTPIGFVIFAGLMVGFAVGSVVVYQILYSNVLDHLSEYATLKAIGHSDRFLTTIVLNEATILAVLGYLPGLLISVFVYSLTRSVANLPAELTLARIVIVFLLTITMCVIAGLFATKALRTVDPAEVF